MDKRKIKTPFRRDPKKQVSLFVLFVLLGVGFFTACNSSSNNPAQPFGSSALKTPTNTPTGTITNLFTPTFTGTLPTNTLTPTNTPTGIIITNTPTITPTKTWTPAAPPAYQNNYGTSAAPNGMYYDSNSGVLYTAQAENKGGTIVNALEEFVNSGGGVLAFNGTGNLYANGQATPTKTYQPTPYIFAGTQVSFPQGVAVSSPGGFLAWPGIAPRGAGLYPGMVAMLDIQNGGGAILYVENNYVYGPPALDDGPFMNFTNGFGGAVFHNPKSLTADTSGHFYVADTGNGYVDEFDGGGGLYGLSPSWLHRWNGSGSNFSASITFKQPNSIACDTADNVYIGDPGPYAVSAGVSTSIVQVYTSGGTTLVGAFPLIAGCVVNGITTDSAGDFFVSDTSNGEVEEYTMLTSAGTPWACCNAAALGGTVLTQVGLKRAWGDAHSYHEFAPYTPSCLEFLGGGYIVVGDSGNDFLNVFGPGLP